MFYMLYWNYLFLFGIISLYHVLCHDKKPLLPQLVDDIVENEISRRVPSIKAPGKKASKRNRLTGSHMKAATDAINKLVDESIVNRVEEAEREVSQMLLRNIEHHIQDAGKIFLPADDKSGVEKIVGGSRIDRSLCRDKLDSCEKLAEAGVCKTSRDAMRVNCRQTCNYCHIMLDQDMQSKLANELETHNDGKDKVLSIKWHPKGKHRKHHRKHHIGVEPVNKLATDEIGMLGEDISHHDNPSLDRTPLILHHQESFDSRNDDTEQEDSEKLIAAERKIKEAKELERIKEEANKLLAAQRKIKDRKEMQKERDEAEKLLETEKTIKEEEQRELDIELKKKQKQRRKHLRKKKKQMVHKPSAKDREKASKCHPICTLQCIPICAATCCNLAGGSEAEEVSNTATPDTFCHPLCRQICLPSCGDGCCGDSSAVADAQAPPASRPPPPPPPSPPPPSPPRPSAPPPPPPPITLAPSVDHKNKGLCPPACPVECAPYCLDSCCLGPQALSMLTRPMSKSKSSSSSLPPLTSPGKGNNPSCPYSCSESCAPECTPGCCLLFPMLINSIKGMTKKPLSLPNPPPPSSSSRKAPPPPPLSPPFNFCKAPCPANCSPSCLPSCCKPSKASKTPLKLTEPSQVSLTGPGAKDLTCASEGITEVCGENGIGSPTDNSQDPPGTIVIPLPPVSYTPSKAGGSPTEIPIPDISLPLSMLQGKSPSENAPAPVAGPENKLSCLESCPQSCAPECRDDCCTAEVPKNSPVPPSPPPLFSGVPGVVELTPTLVNLPNTFSPHKAGVVELKPSEVSVPSGYESCPAKCSATCLPDCDYDCCKPYLDPNIVSEMSNELNYYHPDG